MSYASAERKSIIFHKKIKWIYSTSIVFLLIVSSLCGLTHIDKPSKTIESAGLQERHVEIARYGLRAKTMA